MNRVVMNRMIVPLYEHPISEDTKSSNSYVVDEALYGMQAEVLEDDLEEWIKVRMDYHYEGYVLRRHIYPILFDHYIKRGLSRLMIIKCSYSDVLVKPTVQAKRILSLTRGAIVNLLDEVKEVPGWYSILLNNGEIGYIRRVALTPYTTEVPKIEEYELRNRIVQTALSYRHTQYRWGGKTPLGIDCSGLCSMAYLMNGIIIYRDAKMKEGFPIHEICLKDIKPCDLIYYKGHITLYIGKGQYIHATAYEKCEGVVINSLNPKDKNYREDLARTILKVGSFFGE